MKTHEIVASTLVLFALCLGGASASAQSGGPAAGQAKKGQSAAPAKAGKAAPAKPPKRDPKEANAAARKQYEEGQKRRAAEQLARLEALDLSDEQRRAVEDLPKHQDEWQAEHRAQLESIRDRLQVARADGDMESVKALTAERQALVAGRPKLADILTVEQMKQFSQSGASARRPAPAAGGPPPNPNAAQHRPAQPVSPEIQALQKEMHEARLAGDVERVKELQLQMRMIKQAVRDANAAKAAEASGDDAGTR